MKDFSKETIRKFAELAGYTFTIHIVSKRNLLTNGFDKTKVTKAYLNGLSVEIEPCNQYKPWEDVREADRLLNAVSESSTIHSTRNHAIVKLHEESFPNDVICIGLGDTRQEAICDSVYKLIQMGRV